MKRCSKCGSMNTTIYESRIRPDGYVRRRRSCLECGFKWTTIEVYSYEFEQLQDFKEAVRLDAAVPPMLRGLEKR